MAGAKKSLNILYGYQKSRKRTNISGKGNLDDIDISVSINKVCFGWSIPCLLRVCLVLLSCPKSRGKELDSDQIWLGKPKIFTVLLCLQKMIADPYIRGMWLLLDIYIYQRLAQGLVLGF